MIRRAVMDDAGDINRILYQVNDVHAQGRPDIFKKGGVKYDLAATRELIHDPEKEIFVCTDENNTVLGYLIGWFEEVFEDTSRRHRKTMYIDDICVDEKARRRHAGEELYRHAEAIASSKGCDSITLNVWECNPAAMKFYVKMGLLPMKTTMEKCL